MYLYVIARRAPLVELLGDDARQELLAGGRLTQTDGEAECGDDGKHDVAHHDREELRTERERARVGGKEGMQSSDWDRKTKSGDWLHGHISQETPQWFLRRT